MRGSGYGRHPFRTDPVTDPIGVSGEACGAVWMGFPQTDIEVS